MKKWTVWLRVTIPVCSLRRGYAREYLETERVPPPSTIYGFLLSLVGEEDRMRYIETNIAYAVLREPQISVVLRTAWRIKELQIGGKGKPKTDQPIGTGSNKRPDYQEILTGLDLGIWVNQGGLADRLRAASANPESTDRYGGLSLGESRDLINDIWWFPDYGDLRGNWVVPREEGNLTLPIWVDHVGSEGTVWRPFILLEGRLACPPPDSSLWISIVPRADGGRAVPSRSSKRGTKRHTIMQR
ncbi:MAG: type I-MYXAN CRISPR-associated protein Cas5/Cmx5/DevS [Syntrophobacteraceae bacterium]